jgi:CheY-like chemotaxis protein
MLDSSDMQERSIMARILRAWKEDKEQLLSDLGGIESEYRNEARIQQIERTIESLKKAVQVAEVPSSLRLQAEGHSYCPKLPRGEEQKWILVVEDDEAHASMLDLLFKQETSHSVCYTSDGQTAWKFLQHFKPDLLVLDYLLPKVSGLVLYDRIRAEKALHNIPVLMISAALPSDEIEQRGIIGLQKPFEIDAFLHAIEVLIASA